MTEIRQSWQRGPYGPGWFTWHPALYIYTPPPVSSGGGTPEDQLKEDNFIDPLDLFELQRKQRIKDTEIATALLLMKRNG